MDLDPDASADDAVETRRTRVPSSPLAPRQARRWLGWLERYLPPDRLDSARLMVSELVSNSVMHAGLAEGEAIHVMARADDARVRIIVCDCGRGFELEGRPTRPPPHVHGGLGLWMVDQLADSMKLDGARGRVSFELDRGTAAR